MKLFFVFAALSLSLSSFAYPIDSKKLVSLCRPIGVSKILQQAEFKNVRIDPRDVKECGMDNRPLNPSSYVWFCAVTNEGMLFQAMTQKPARGNCF